MKKRLLNAIRQRRIGRVRARVLGTKEKPRLSVFRSNRGIYAQLIDDSAGRTIAAVSSREIPGSGKKKTDQAILVGEKIAAKAKQAGVSSAVFDRRSYRYHGRIKAVAEAARKSGLVI